jgi:hypothetical protein
MKRRGVLDFEDLVVRTATLLARADAAAWVHYKLDRGLEHILVDEAQDTSPRQWQVVKRWPIVLRRVRVRHGPHLSPSATKAVDLILPGAVPSWFGDAASSAPAPAAPGSPERSGPTLLPLGPVVLRRSMRSSPRRRRTWPARVSPMIHRRAAQPSAASCSGR